MPSSSVSSGSTTTALRRSRSSTGSSPGRRVASPVVSPNGGSAVPRDVFIVANNIQELGGAIRFTHTLGRLLSEQGHRVRLVGIVPPPEVFDYGAALPYSLHALHEHHPPRPAEGRG